MVSGGPLSKRSRPILGGFDRSVTICDNAALATSSVDSMERLGPTVLKWLQLASPRVMLCVRQLHDEHEVTAHASIVVTEQGT
jgi:hypothetical protein